jgi:hypothetical protein
MGYSAWRQHKTEREYDGLLKKYERIAEGMTEAEVGVILGPENPEPEDALFAYPGGSLGEHRCFWHQGETVLYVTFYSSWSQKQFRWGVVEKGFGAPKKRIRRTL